MGLILVAIAFHIHSGFIAYGGKNFDVYMKSSLRGRHALKVARKIPQKGVLLTESSYAGMCANRPDILTWRQYRSGQDIDIVFADAASLMTKQDGYWKDIIQSGEFGISFYDGIYMVAERGYDGSRNGIILDRIRGDFKSIALSTSNHGGNDILDRNDGLVRYWEGDGSRGPIVLSFGSFCKLEAGSYQAVFRFRAAEPERKVRDSCGWLSVHFENAPESIAEDEIDHIASRREFRDQRVRFELTQPAVAELRITGADAPLWLKSLWIEPIISD